MRNCVGIFLLFLAAGLSRADDSSLGPQPGVLLLRNGSVLDGKILRSGDRYDVGIKDGELRVKVSDVVYVGNSLEACYEFRRGGIEFDQVDERLELAEWCLRHRMFAEAGRELREAIAIEPVHPKIAVVERRLRLAIDGPSEARPAEPGRIDAATPEELDRMIRSMPAGTVEAFTNTVQPMLLNQCSTAGCHGPASATSLRLLRITSGRTQSRRATQRNLHAVLAAINHDNPEESPLLRMSLRPHGTSRTAVYASKQTLQYKQLVAWTFAVAHQKRPNALEGETSSTETPFAFGEPPQRKSAENSATQSPTIAAKYLQQSEDHNTDGNATLESDVKPASAQEPSDGSPDETDEEKLPPAKIAPRRAWAADMFQVRSPARSTPKRGELPKDEAPADPFDPEQFNKKYLGG